MRKDSNSKNNNKREFENMKYEIADEFGVRLGPDATSRDNGSVGGEMTRRLVEKGRSKLGGNHEE